MRDVLVDVALLARREMVQARRNRWILLYAALFAVLSAGLSWVGLSGLSSHGLSGFGRTAASMINLVMLVVPLMGLTLGATGLAGERDSGVLVLVMSQPLSPFEILLGKFAGLALALLAALLVGFGLSGALIAWYGGTTSVGQFVALVGLTFLVALVSLALGLAVAGVVRRTDAAVGVVLVVWLGLVVLSDLGLIGAALLGLLGIHDMFLLALLNPLHVFKLAAVLSLRGGLDVFGPVGVYAVRTYGAGLLPLLVGILVAWTLVALAASVVALRRRGAV